MDIKLTKQFLLSCHEAKRIIEHMPALPKGMKPRHLYILEILEELSKTQELVRVSDISNHLHVTKPSITKLINELVDLHMVEKKQHETDHRVYTLTLTEKGRRTFDLYGTGFHNLVNDQLSHLSPEDLQTAIRVIHEASSAVDRARVEFEKRRVDS